MKKVLLFLILLFFCVRVNAEDFVVFKDDNLKKALVEQHDINKDGEISYEEASKVESMAPANKSIKYLDGLEYFSNVKELWLNNNEIEDLSVLKNLKNIEKLDISHNNVSNIDSLLELSKLESLTLHDNKINCSPLRHFDNHTVETIKKFANRGVKVYGPSEQKIEYDSSRVNKKNKYKVLFVYLSDLDVNVKKDGKRNGKILNYKHKITEDEKIVYKKIEKQFEQYVEKLSDYNVDIIVESYTLKNKITKLVYSGEMTDETTAAGYRLAPDDIKEIENKIKNYDTTILTLLVDSNIVFHQAGGFASTAYFDNIHVVGNAMVYIDESNIKTEKIMDNGLVGGYVHEFQHTVEWFNKYTMNYNIWEYHDTIYSLNGYLTYDYHNDNIIQNSTYLGDHLYLKGATNPKNSKETGITPAMWAYPPTKYNLDHPEEKEEEIKEEVIEEKPEQPIKETEIYEEETEVKKEDTKKGINDYFREEVRACMSIVSIFISIVALLTAIYFVKKK